MAAAAMMSAADGVHLDWEEIVVLTSRATTWVSEPIPKRAATLFIGLMDVPPGF